MMLLTFGAVTAYFVIIGQLLAQVLHHPLKCVALSTSCVWVTQCAIGVGVASVAPADCECTRSLAQACRLSGPWVCLPHARARPRTAGEGTHGRSAAVRLCVDAPAQTIGDCLRAYRVHVDLGSIYLERNFLSAIVISLSERSKRTL